MNQLIILRGIPGSGKTTFADYLQDIIEGCEIYAADDFFMVNGQYTFDVSKLHQAHEACQRNVLDAMIEEVPCIVVHNTSTTERELAPYLEMAQVHYYNVTVLVVENRHGNSNIHGVPEEKLGQMKQRLMGSIIL